MSERIRKATVYHGLYSAFTELNAKNFFEVKGKTIQFTAFEDTI